MKPGPLGEPAERLLAAVGLRGHVVVANPEALRAASVASTTPLVTLAISDGPMVFDFLGFVRSLGDCRLRVLMLSRLGAHPDARTSSLQRLWRLEEHVRAGGLPTLTLRFAPLVGPGTPLWQKLRSRPGLPNRGRKLVNPVAEVDAIETILRALDGRALWQGWYEVAGDDVLSLAELSEIAARTPGDVSGGDLSGGHLAAPDWEPALDEIAEHRLAESAPWARHFGIVPTPLAAWTTQGVA